MLFLNLHHLGTVSVLLLLLGQPVLASDLIFSQLQFRATVENLPSSGAYLSIKNDGEAAERLLDVTSDLARKTELHEMKISNGIMKMRRVIGGIEIPAGETVNLTPGGYHVMLMGLKAPLHANSIFQITLIFKSAGKIIIKGIAKQPADLMFADPIIMHKHKMD